MPLHSRLASWRAPILSPVNLEVSGPAPLRSERRSPTGFVHSPIRPFRPCSSVSVRVSPWEMFCSFRSSQSGRGLTILSSLFFNRYLPRQISSFVILSSFVIRHSSFGPPAPPTAQSSTPHPCAERAPPHGRRPWKLPPHFRHFALRRSRCPGN